MKMFSRYDRLFPSQVIHHGLVISLTLKEESQIFFCRHLWCPLIWGLCLIQVFPIEKQKLSYIIIVLYKSFLLLILFFCYLASLNLLPTHSQPLQYLDLHFTGSKAHMHFKLWTQISEHKLLKMTQTCIHIINSQHAKSFAGHSKDEVFRWTNDSVHLLSDV